MFISADLQEVVPETV